MESSIETTKFEFPWILWYHDPENRDYSLKSYVRIADVITPQQFWTLIDSISKEAWESGMFFFMRSGYRPLWDAPENEGGGAWSKKIEASEVYSVFVDLMTHCITHEILSSKKETIAGVTISPKGPFSIIKIWNTDTKVSSNSYLNQSIHQFKVGDDVTYTAHKARPK